MLARSVIELPELVNVDAEELIPKLVPMIERYMYCPDLTARPDDPVFVSHPPNMLDS